MNGRVGDSQLGGMPKRRPPINQPAAKGKGMEWGRKVLVWLNENELKLNTSPKTEWRKRDKWRCSICAGMSKNEKHQHIVLASSFLKYKNESGRGLVQEP